MPDALGARSAGTRWVSAEPGGAGPVKSALRTVELLEYFAGHRGLHSLAELQQSLGYPKSSLYMLLRTLTDLGWVETDSTGTLYGIGLRALLVGTSYIDGDHIVRAARDTLDWLAETTTETVPSRGSTAPTWCTSPRASHSTTSGRCPGSVGGCRRIPPHWARRCSPSAPTRKYGRCCRGSSRR